MYPSSFVQQMGLLLAFDFGISKPWWIWLNPWYRIGSCSRLACRFDRRRRDSGAFAASRESVDGRHCPHTHWAQAPLESMSSQKPRHVPYR
jgi:hypothetical protein